MVREYHGFKNYTDLVRFLIKREARDVLRKKEESERPNK